MKMFVTDYDGTLFTNNKALKLNKKKIKKLHKLNVIITVSTGRSYASIKEQLTKYNIYYDYINCSDGSFIFNNKDELINFYKMNKDIANDVLTFANSINHKEIQICYPREYSDVLKNDLDIAGINVVIESLKMTDDIKNKFYQLKEKHNDYNFLYYDHGDYIYLCIKAKNVSKALSLQYMQNYLNINSKDIFVIGDSNNDIEMIREYNGVSIISDNLDVLAVSSRQYHQVYEYIDDIIVKIS